MRISEEDWEDIMAYLRDVSLSGEIESPEDFVELLKEHWDDIKDPTKMDKKALRRELQTLRASRTAARDAIDVMTARIDEILAILNGE